MARPSSSNVLDGDTALIIAELNNTSRYRAGFESMLLPNGITYRAADMAVIATNPAVGYWALGRSLSSSDQMVWHKDQRQLSQLDCFIESIDYLPTTISSDGEKDLVKN